MSSRHRPRANHNQDADEERRIWRQIREDAKKIDSMVARSAAIGNEIVEVEQQQAALVEAGKLATAEDDAKLEALYRESIKINEVVAHLINGKSDDTNLLDSIHILAALRETSESQPIVPTRDKSRNSLKRKLTGQHDSAEGDETSAAPSPRVSIGGPGRESKDRLTVERSREQRRERSVTSTREVSVKLEDGAESVASSVEGSKAPSDTSKTPSGRLTLNLGAMVFYRNKTRASEGEGILCRVTSVIGEGKQRRYEIQDADPEPDPVSGEMPTPYRASVAHLVPIPQDNKGLKDLAKGAQVLAQYPDTTTFYKAEVSTAWKFKEGGMVRLRFEGEQEETKEQEVERRFVLAERA